MLERATWAKMKEVHKVDIVEEQRRRENRRNNFWELKYKIERGQTLSALVLDCTFEDRQDVVCRINLEPEELNAVIEYENRAIESLENELEGM